MRPGKHPRHARERRPDTSSWGTWPSFLSCALSPDGQRQLARLPRQPVTVGRSLGTFGQANQGS